MLAILVVGYIFNYLFSNSLPALGQKLGIDFLATSLLTKASTAWIGIVILAVWQAAAFTIIIYIAGLQTVPAELYEAASIDGASAWQQFRSITFPMIAGFFTINMVLSLKGFLQIFDHIVALTGGGPGTDTESVALLIYKGGFQGGEYGYQSANAVVFFIVIVAFSIIQLRFLQRGRCRSDVHHCQRSRARRAARRTAEQPAAVADARGTRRPGQLVADRAAHRPVADHRSSRCTSPSSPR